jgi:hypothetical protein
MACRLIVETPPNHVGGVLHVMHSFGCSAFDVLCCEEVHAAGLGPARLIVSANAEAAVRGNLEKELHRILAGTGSVAIMDATNIQ